MKRILSDYLEICNKFRKSGLGKVERKLRHVLLSEWNKKDYGDEIVSVGEIKDFWSRHSDICRNVMFVNKVICPAVTVDFDNGGIEGLQFLFYCFRGCENSYISTDNPVRMFCKYSNKYDPFQLADALLECDPDNVDALKYKYYVLKYFLEFSIHEMPYGVLNGMDGASFSDISDMQNDLDEFECISKKLNLSPCKVLVEDCRRYYKAYGDYLRHSDLYKDFEDYLRLNGISYKIYTSRFEYE